MKPKYITREISGIITQIATTTGVNGYTIGVIESFIPDEEETKFWSEEDHDKWIKQNNIRMKAICEMLNDRNL